MWENFCLDSKNFQSEVALTYFVGQLGQSNGTARAQDTKKSTSVIAVAKLHSLETTVSWASFFWSVPIEGNLFL